MRRKDREELKVILRDQWIDPDGPAARAWARAVAKGSREARGEKEEKNRRLEVTLADGQVLYVKAYRWEDFDDGSTIFYDVDGRVPLAVYAPLRTVATLKRTKKGK